MPDWSREDREAYLALSMVSGVGAVRLSTLLERFGSPSAVLAAPRSELAEVSGLGQETVAGILAADRAAAAKVVAALEAEGDSVLLQDEPHFPALLREIPDPPLFLFARGNLALLDSPAVAIVGSRDHTDYGAEVCRALARAAAEAGLVVVSGMARGLDAVAHRSALAANGGTIGVLANGLDVVYPPSNRDLYQEMAARGLLLTETLPGLRPGLGGFPRRNRLISGLARVTVVVEGAMTSGALGTSRCAQDQGREVMAVPGPITSPVSVGCNDLLRDGAAPLLELADLLSYYPELARKPDPTAAAAREPVHPLERRLLNALQLQPLGVERLVELSGAPVALALDALSALELGGKVKRELGGHYRLTGQALFR